MSRGREAPAGFVSGSAHEVRIRPVIGEVAAAPTIAARSAAGATIARFGAAAVATCDLTRVTANAVIPSTRVADDEAAGCVVNGAGAGRPAERLLLGAARDSRAATSRRSAHGGS